MTSEVASPKSTGGGGFVFEDKVCAWFLAHMLAGDPPLEATLGSLERVEFQTRPDGWLLDDLLLTLGNGNGKHRCAFSVKSNTQFVGSRAPEDFVRTVWEQFLGTVSPKFDARSDFLGLVTAPLPIETREALNFVVSVSKEGDPKLLPGRFSQKGWANEAKRSLFKSFSCPPDLAQEHRLTAGDVGRLLARLRFLQFDFEAPSSEAEKQAGERCRRALRSGEVKEGMKLWGALLQLSANRRPTGGYITRMMLLDELRHHFRLLDLPDHREDWGRLRNLTSANISQIRDTIGGLVEIQRQEELDGLTSALSRGIGVVLLGPSGVGKSAIAKRVAEKLMDEGRKCIWFDARSFDRPDFAALQSNLQLTHPLSELLSTVPDSSSVIILDGLDRLYEANAFSLVAALLNAMGLGSQGSPWHMVVTCQTQEWDRLQQSLLRVGLPATTWGMVECKPLSIDDDLKPVWSAIPAAARLQYQGNLRPLLGNLKVLDLVASRLVAGIEVQTSTWVGESSVASWFWEAQVSVGEERRARERLAMLIAERQADDLRPATPLDVFNVSELSPLDGLERDGVCRRTHDGKVIFTHDLFGDWARLRAFLPRSDDLVEFLGGRLDSPLWHRAVRLYGLHLLEHEGNIERWRTLLAALSQAEDKGAGDLLLESIIFAMDPLPLLRSIRGDLVRDEGKLLRRLLGRFLTFATLPDPGYLSLAQAEGQADTSEVAARFRYPNWPYWPPMLLFLHEHRTEIVPVAPVEVARVTELWLEHAPKGAPLRRESAEMGLMLGERARAARNDYGGIDYEHRKLYYQVALAGADELPDEVARFALKASERTTKENEVEDAGDAVDDVPIIVKLDLGYDPAEAASGPWPDGPRVRVDDDFQEVALDSRVLIRLIQAKPTVAREVILASLIRAPQRFQWSYPWFESRELDLDENRRWHPPLYIHGPFLGFLKMDFCEGLETIARLVDFATERWQYYTAIKARQDEEESQEQGSGAGPLDRMVSQWPQPPGTVVLSLDQGERELLGDARVYGWSVGLSNPPSAVEVALMALEQYFYLEIAGGRPVEEKLHVVLGRARSVAFLKVLCDVGKRKSDLFEGPLRPLLAIPEIYEWEILAHLQSGQRLIFGAPRHGEWFYRLAQDFYGMEHRSRDLHAIAVQLFLGSESMRVFLTDVRNQWEDRLKRTSDGTFRDFLQGLVVSFDIDNYRLVDDPEHGNGVVNERAKELYAERSGERMESEERLFLTALPLSCRRMIDEGIILSGNELEGFWDQVQGIAKRAGRHSSANLPATEPPTGLHAVARRPSESLATGRVVTAPGPLRWLQSKLRSWFTRSESPPEDDAGTRNAGQEPAPARGENTEDLVNALMGAAAVFIRLHGGWLAKHPERRQWCINQFRTAILSPPLPAQMDVPESVGAFTWDCFAAEALPVLWAEEPDNTELRDLVARLVFAYHYDAVRILFCRCAEHRAILGADFDRLRRLLFEAAHVRNRTSFVQQARHYHHAVTDGVIQRFDKTAEEWVKERVTKFLERKLPPTSERWQDMDQPERFGAIDGLRQKRFGHYFLDFHLVRAAHEWLPTLDRALNEQERNAWISFWRAALAFSLDQIPGERGHHNYPNDDDRWVIDGVAASLPLMTPSEQPEALWRPILDLPSEAEGWPADFLRSFHQVGLRHDPVSTSFASLRVAIIEYALGNAQGDTGARWSPYDKVWRALIGIDEYTRGCWEPRHRALVEQSSQLLERWMDVVAAYGRHLAALASWLEREAADPARLLGLVLLDRVLTEGSAEQVYDRASAEDPVASLLSITWQRDEARLRGDQVSFTTFRRLLRWLANEQNPLALELLRKLGNL